MAKGRDEGARAPKWWTEDEARAALAAWEKSGQSGAAYARSIGVDPQRLYSWRRRLRTRSAGARAFVPVVTRTPVPEGLPALVVTRGGIRIEVRDVDASTAAWVVALLAGEERS